VGEGVIAGGGSLRRQWLNLQNGVDFCLIVCRVLTSVLHLPGILAVKKYKRSCLCFFFLLLPMRMIFNVFSSLPGKQPPLKLY